MLEPTNRLMLVDALRPPEGFRLDTAVGTTFTLDLNALLLATVSFAVFDRIDNEAGQPDPIALLESVRRHADNVTLFAQAGALFGPKAHPPILAYLEEAVVPVRVPRPGHLFHPKVWAMRFINDEGVASYRLLVLSRNLTFDSSWDTIVRLDGSPSTDAPVFSGVVGDFIAGLPAQAIQPVAEQRAARIAALATDLRDVRWQTPDGVKWLRFHPMGEGFKAPNLRGDRSLVMSPFLSESTVRDLSSGAGPNVLISRASSLDQVGAAAVAGFDETFVVDVGDEVLSSSVLVEDGDEEPPRPELDEAPETHIDFDPPRPATELSGLHAKVFLIEKSGQITLWLGSPNATTAAFGGNTEFAVELGLDPDLWTIERFLDDGGNASLRAMLQSYRPVAEEAVEPSETEQALYRIDTLLRELAARDHAVHVSPAEGASADESYRLDLSWEPLDDRLAAVMERHNIAVAIGPATQLGLRVPYAESGAAVPSATLQSVTSFLLIEARTRVDGQELTGRTLINARLSGAPVDRKERLLASTLDDPAKVLRYLLFLLAELTGDSTLLDQLGGGSASFDWSASPDSPPLLETLLRALARSPKSLDQVSNFVDDLRSGSGESLLPSDFEEVWEPIDEARRRMR